MLANLVRVVSATVGTGTITLGAAVSGCLTFAGAGIPDGTLVSYGISDGSNSEVGRGTYSAGTLTRTTVLASTNGGAKINLSGSEQVYVAVLAEDVAKASGAEVLAGTDDVKFATPKALKDGGVPTTKANGGDVIAGTDDAKFITAKALKDGGVVALDLISSVPHRQKLIMAKDWKPRTSNGCGALAQIEMPTNKENFEYLPFDALVNEFAFANLIMPEDYTGGVIYFAPYWFHPSTTVNFGVSYYLSAVSYSNNDPLDVALGTNVFGDDVGGVANRLYAGVRSTPVTIAGTPAAGDLVQLMFARNGADTGVDTLAVDMNLLGVMIWYPVG